MNACSNSFLYSIDETGFSTPSSTLYDLLKQSRHTPSLDIDHRVLLKESAVFMSKNAPNANSEIFYVNVQVCPTSSNCVLQMYYLQCITALSLARIKQHLDYTY